MQLRRKYVPMVPCAAGPRRDNVEFGIASRLWLDITRILGPFPSQLPGRAQLPHPQDAELATSGPRSQSTRLHRPRRLLSIFRVDTLLATPPPSILLRTHCAPVDEGGLLPPTPKPTSSIGSLCLVVLSVTSSIWRVGGSIMMVGTEDADRAADLKPPLSSNERLEGLSKLALPLQVNNSIVVGCPSATTSFAEELVTRKHGGRKPDSSSTCWAEHIWTP